MRLLRRIVRIIFSSVLLTTVTVVGAPVALAVTVLSGLVLLPLPATIPVPATRALAEPSTVYDRYGHPLGTFAQFDRNTPVAQADIPQVLEEAVIADEDRNFYAHGGVDLRGTARALLADLRSNRTVQGGSTITQQYVKLAFLGAQRTVVRKVREAVLASQLDRQASKAEILYRYLTLVYFGNGNYGIGAAAENYFHVPVSQLTASQSATLAGLIPAPTTRAPTTDLALAEQYRQLVLGKMFQQGYLNLDGYRTAVSQRLVLASPSGTPAPPAGTTVVYPTVTPPSTYPAFVDYVRRWLLDHGYSSQDLTAGGLKIQTTLDPRLQDAANAAVSATLSGTAPPLNMALASVEPQTGFVEALVGGRDFGRPGAATSLDNFAISACDNAGPGAVATAVRASSDPAASCWNGSGINNAGGSGRQPGSSWKPFVLATAFEQGVQPGKVYSAPSVLQIPGCKVLAGQTARACQIGNDEGGGGGSATLSAAMAASINTVYAQLAPDVGCANVARTAKALGVASAYYSTTTFPFCQTYALGVLDVSPLDMASAYGVFDNHGDRAAPTPILEIVDGTTGKVRLDNISKAPPTAPVMPANVADNVTTVLQGVLAPGGTAAAHTLNRPAAGKTGTTSNFTNAWFTGYTPTLSTSVWMGNNAQNTPIGPLKGFGKVFGGTLPAATWADFMTRALATVPVTPFGQPAPIVAPLAAPVLGAPVATTRPTLAPGRSGTPVATPTGGPYVLGPAAPPVAVPPPTAPPITTSTPGGIGSPSSTTGVPGPASTFPGETTTTTRPGFAPLP